MGLIAKILGGIIIFVGIIDISHLLLAALSSTTYTFAYMLVQRFQNNMVTFI